MKDRKNGPKKGPNEENQGEPSFWEHLIGLMNLAPFRVPKTKEELLKKYQEDAKERKENGETMSPFGVVKDFQKETHESYQKSLYDNDYYKRWSFVLLFLLFVTVITYFSITFDVMSFLPTVNLKVIFFVIFLYILLPLSSAAWAADNVFMKEARRRHDPVLIAMCKYLIADIRRMMITVIIGGSGVLLVFQPALMKAGFASSPQTSETYKTHPDSFGKLKLSVQAKDDLRWGSSNPFTDRRDKTLPFGKPVSYFLLVFSLLLAYYNWIKEKENLIARGLSILIPMPILLMGDLRIIVLRFGTHWVAGTTVGYFFLGISLIICAFLYYNFKKAKYIPGVPYEPLGGERKPNGIIPYSIGENDTGWTQGSRK